MQVSIIIDKFLIQLEVFIRACRCCYVKKESNIGVLTCLYLEFLESQIFKHILPNDIQFFRYIDILIIYPKEHNIPFSVHKLNKVKPSINFTYKFEKNNSLHFLDILLINNNNKLEFKVYDKINNKNDFIHFYSNLSDKTKSGILLGFFPESPYHLLP